MKRNVEGGLSMFDEMLKIAKIKLQKAQERLIAAESDYDTLMCELEFISDDAQSEIDEAEIDVEKAKKEYEFLLEQLANDKIRKPKNAFEKKFYQAARFCRKELSDTRYLNYVKVENDRIIACDGYAAVTIKCDIPKNLVNKLVPWDTTDFKDYTMNKYPDIDKIINDTIQNSPQTKVFSKSNFLEIVDKTTKEEDRETVILNLTTVKIAINKKYLDYTMDCFKAAENFTVSWKDEESAIVLKNDTVTALILPMVQCL